MTMDEARNESVCSTSSTNDSLIQQVYQNTETFYKTHSSLIKPSHGWEEHVQVVHQHAQNAIQCHQPVLTSKQRMEVEIAALLHDVDDTKYFSSHQNYENAKQIMIQSNIPNDSQIQILKMISWVSCRSNGNKVPDDVLSNNAWYMLIPRWADRLEAVGSRGVIRCYQYSIEYGRPLSNPERSPRPTTLSELWNYATPERFERYQEQEDKIDNNSNGEDDDDMISHYYDKLLHVARPPPSIVRNSYLEEQAQRSVEPLLQVCLDYGRTGNVNVEYIHSLMTAKSNNA